MIKMICPYCGGRLETYGTPDGNPYNENRKEKTVCTACGQTVYESEPLQIPDEHLKELMTDADIADEVSSLSVRIRAKAEGGGVTRKAEIVIPYEDGVYSLGDEYPFGRIDVDRDPMFSLREAKVRDDEITVANETVKLSALTTQTVTVKLTAYGYGYVPWEETITLVIGVE